MRDLLELATKRPTKLNLLRASAYPLVKAIPSLRILIVVAAAEKSICASKPLRRGFVVMIPSARIRVVKWPVRTLSFKSGLDLKLLLIVISMLLLPYFKALAIYLLGKSVLENMH
ncbi:MAG: hypothetical protein QXM43_01035 [Desulfurococcaceae archaeon]